MYMASIEDQFEFLQRHWANSPSRPKGSDADDLVIGLPEDRKKTASFDLQEEGAAAAHVTVETDTAFTTATGLGYFLMPSPSAIRDVLCAPAVEGRRRRAPATAGQPAGPRESAPLQDVGLDPTLHLLEGYLGRRRCYAVDGSVRAPEV